MKITTSIFLLLLAVSMTVKAEWYLRGTFNDWNADPMYVTSDNIAIANDVDFPSDGSFKFDRWGDWSENYGLGGRDGGNIFIGEGTYNIHFFIDFITWRVTPANFHFRGTPNQWREGTLLTPVADSHYLLETCQDFTGQQDPRFKIDPNGGWGEDSFPAQDYRVSPGWVRIQVDAYTSSITQIQQNLGEDCEPGELTLYLRGTFNDWQETTLFTKRMVDNTYEACEFFGEGGEFKVDPYGGWGGDEFPATNAQASGWTYIVADAVQLISVETDLGANCSLVPVTEWYVRGTYNMWDLTPMEYVGGGTYTATIDITTGDSPGRFKVDDGVWGDPRPASGDGIEVDFCAQYKIIFNNSHPAAVPSFVKIADLPIEQCEQREFIRDFRKETMYFVFTDRFYDGDPGNNEGNNPATYDPNKLNWRKYFGGDIQGLIDQLDYLEALGVTSIWTTPMVDNSDFVETELDQAGYHGYWARDFFQIDEHLGDWEKFDELIREMTLRGMKMVMDFVPNHSGNAFDGTLGQLYRNGVAVSLTHPADALLSPEDQWFHHEGGIDGDQLNSCNFLYQQCAPVDNCFGVEFCADEWDASPQRIIKDIFGLADLAVEKPFVEAYLLDAAKNWMDHGVRGFRIDAIKNVDPEFAQRLADELNAYAKTLGYDGIYIVGEWYDAGVGGAVSRKTGLHFAATTQDIELLDFGLRQAIEGVVSGDLTFTALNSHLEARPDAWLYREDWQSIFMDNHDAPRTALYLDIWKGFSPDFVRQRVDLGLALLMTLPGIPVIYYGTEQYAAVDIGGGVDPYNREMMPSFDTNTGAFAIVSRLSKLRKSSPAIQRGSYQQLWLNQDILVFERRDADDVVVVALNRGPTKEISVEGSHLANGEYASLVGTDSILINEGKGTFNLSQNEAVVLHSGNLLPAQ